MRLRIIIWPRALLYLPQVGHQTSASRRNSANPLGEIASNTKRMGGRVHAICNDTDIIALGERAHQAFPECPSLESMSFAKGRAGTSLFWRSILMGLFGIFLHPLQKPFRRIMSANGMRSSTPWIERPTC